MFEIPYRYGGPPVYTSKTAGDLSVALMEAVKIGANLAGANLASANLASANLARANLAGANLAGANLAGTNLASANLAGANLAGTNLAGANLAGANLASANLASANLARANLETANAEYVCNGRFFQLANVCEWGPLLAYVTTANECRILIGCQCRTLAEMMDHWKDRVDRPISRVALQMVGLWFDAVK